MKVYVASSWRNDRYPFVVEALRASGHEVYDFRDANRAFNWAQIDAAWDPANPILTRDELIRALESEQAEVAFTHDKDALDWAEAGVLVMPCGRSAHLEAGYLRGRGKPVHILLADNEKPDLMHKLAEVHGGIETILPALRNADPKLCRARDRVECYQDLVVKWSDRAEEHRKAGRAVMATAAEEARRSCQEQLALCLEDLALQEARLPSGNQEKPRWEDCRCSPPCGPDEYCPGPSAPKAEPHNHPLSLGCGPSCPQAEPTVAKHLGLKPRRPFPPEAGRDR